MNNLFTTLVTGLALLFTLNMQANPTFPAFPNNKSDYTTFNHEKDFLMDDFIVSGSTVSGDVGDIVCVDVTVENFDNILSFQYSMNFDPTVLQFTEVIDPENIDDLNFGDTDTENGNLGVNWFDGDVTGITIPDGTLLYQVCFEIINSNGASVVAFSGNPTSIEVVDGNEDSVNFESNNGTVVTGGSTPLTVSATTVTAANGDNVCLDITANNFTNLNSFQYSMNFDPAVLMFDQTMDAGSLTGLTFDNSGAGSGNLVVNWNSASGVTLANGTSLYQVCFNVIGTGGTSSSFAFSGNPTAIMVTDADGENITLISNSGGVNVSGGGGGNNGTDFTVTAATPTGNVGDVVCVDVTVENFDNILSFQYSMNFDPSLLQFVEVVDPMNIEDLNFGDTDVANGNLTVNWFDGDINGITVPDGTLLYQVCFEILGGNGVIPITFSGNPTSIEVVDGNEDPVPFASNSGGIDIGGTPPAAMLTINAPNVNANNGDQVCLDIKVNGFTNLTSFQYNVAFDESVLTFDQNIDANALTGLMFDNSGAANGNLSVSWNSASGVTLNNSTTIYQACFNVIGAGGTSSNYAISGGMATDTDGAINFNGNNGSVSVTMPNNGTDFIVTAGTPSGNVGDVVCVDVTVENFNNILSFQYSMNFDPSLLQFVEVVDPMNIDDLNFGDTDVANGNLGVSWFDNDVNGITVPDGTVLYQVCFEILGGTNGQTIPVVFSGSPTSIEVVDGNEDPVVFASNNGGVMIGDPGMATVTFLAPNMMANNGDNVCLNVTTNGFTNLTNFQYTVNFDPSVLSFTQNIDAGNLSGLTFNTANAANGTITVSWNSASGVTLTNGTSLYQACFDVIGAGGTSSTYSFSNGTATDADGAMVNVSGNNGAVNVATPNNGTDLIVTVETAPGNVGDQVCLAVTVENFNNVLSFQYSMNFDPTLLQFVQVIDPENLDDLNFGESDVANGNLTVSWFDNDVNGITLPDGTVIYEVCFTILDDNNGNPITVSISGDPTAIEAVDGNEDPIVFVGVPGGIGEGLPPDPDPIVTFAAPTMSVNNGDNICLDITTNGFANLANFQYTFNYDASVLGFDQNISSGNLSNIMFDNSGASSGNLTVSWDNNGTGVTLPNGTVLYQVCFIVNGGGGSSSTLTFVNGTATDGNGGNVNVNSNNGVINVLTPNNGTDFIVTGSAIEGDIGDVVCVDVTVQNFNNILSFQYSMNFDPTLLEFNEIMDPENIPDLNFGISGVDQGNIGVSWFDDNVQGVTIPDGTVLYQVCFTIIGGNNGQVIPVTFSGDPTDIEVVDGNEDPVVFASNNGSVIINTPPPPNAVNFIFSDETGAPGETVCIPLTTTNFNDVNSMQYSFCYDCSLLTFIEYANPNPTLTAAGSLNASNPNPCELTLSWFDEDINGETLNDNETIIEVCFQINPSANDGQVSPVSVCDTPAIIEIADENSNLIPFNLVNGSIEVVIGSPCMGPITISNQNIENVSPCAGANNGMIDITDAGGNGTGANNYSWVNVDNPNAVLSTMQDLENVGPGTYQVTITGCAGNDAQTFTQEFTIIEPAPITINVTPTPVACNGENTGAISTTVSGGSGMGYTYTWNPSSVTGPNPTGLSAGTYALTVTDSEGCTTSFGPIEITEPSEPFTANTSVTNPACSGETGSIMVNAMGGTTAYSYSLNGTATQNNPLFDGLMPGMYNVLATDMNGCTVSLTDIEITEPAEITITENSSSPDLGNCEGAIDIDLVGGNPGGFTYSWTGPSGPFSSQDISGLCAGEYCVTATDNVGGCTATFCKTLIQPLTVTLVSSQNACFENCNGSAIIDIVGGDGDYTILWSGNQMVINPDNLCADTHTVTVMSGDGQTATLEVVIEEPTSPVVINNPDLNNPTSSTECTGSISITPAGGYGAPYTVTWSPPQAGTTTITDLCAGTYTATVTDSNGCTTEASYTLESPDLEIIDLTSTAVSCSGNEDGTISFGVVGGTTPYDVVVMGNTVVNPDPQSTYSYSNLSAGVYLITVTDGSGTVVTTTVEVMGGEEITTEIIKIVDFTSSSLGSIQISQPTGGTPPYTFQWSNGSNAMNPDNMNPGTYSLTITDAVGCFNTFIDFATVYSFEITDSETVNPPCSGNPVGSITIEATEVTNNLPFTYQWEDGDGNPVGTNSPELTNVPGGTYTVTVTDACGFSINETFVLVANSSLDLDVEATSFHNGFNIRCNGGTSGSAEAFPGNGTEPYVYTWSNNTFGKTIGNVGAGTYSVTVTDNVGCTAESAITLTEPDAININFIIDSISCNGQGDGFINASVSGGVPTGGYNYFWNNGEADNTIGPIGPGNYSVEITDGNDCEVEATVPLPEPEVLDFTFATTPVTETELGSIELFPTGGTQPYFYTWPAGIDGESVVTDLNFGTYAVIVTDANGCTKMNTGIQVQLNTDCFQGSPVVTPNDDSLNDVFRISCSERVLNLEIFNRWGQLVYEADTYADEWNGTTRRGSEVPEGTYFYTFEYIDVNTGETEQVRGSLTLLRN